MPFDRSSGIFAHPTSFPGQHGVGDLGESAFRFIDWLQAAGQRFWQIMPLVPVGPGNSPYASISAFAGNPLLISLPWLVGDGLLEWSDLDDSPWFSPAHVDFEGAAHYKETKFRRAFDRFRAGAGSQLRSDLATFRESDASWLHDFAFFLAAKRFHQEAGWTQWAPELSFREAPGLKEWETRLSTEIEYHEFVQFLFRRQWRELKQYANERDIKVIGDIPIFVAHDSADVWANQSLFRLGEGGQPTVVAGVPPDYFSTTGQLWGNPHYNWQTMAADGFQWWIGRFRSLMNLVDVVRIDHFRGFAASWVVSADAPDAASGRWEQGPGRTLFDAIHDALPQVSIIVEDLGLITSDVRQLRRDLGLPGMAVLQFAFDGDSANLYLPHNYSEPLVVYPGTHDNQTTVGWFQGIDERTRTQVRTYLGRDGADIAWDLIRLALGSTAELAVVALQDVLRLDDSARMNIPGVGIGNWAWRFSLDQLDPGLASGVRSLVETYSRTGIKKISNQTDPYDYTAPGAAHPLHI